MASVSCACGGWRLLVDKLLSRQHLVALASPAAADENARACQAKLVLVLNGKTLAQVRLLLESESCWCLVWRWVLWQRLSHQPEEQLSSDNQRRGLEFLLGNTASLTAFVTSGDCSNWSKAVGILGGLLFVDPSCASGGAKLQLALATALCFGDGQTDPNQHYDPIDAVARYQWFCFGIESGQLLSDGQALKAWHWRYVVGSWHADTCLEWAQEHVNEDLRCLDKIGKAASMVCYRLENHAGVSVHEGLSFYDEQKSTMAIINEYGGVCGAVSKFGTTACQAFGVPAMPVGQPGHCAMIWRSTGGKWKLQNDRGGWQSSYMHAGIQRTWKELNNLDAGLIAVMEEAQGCGHGYYVSEWLRLIAPVVDADIEFEVLAESVDRCPYNLPAWRAVLQYVQDYGGPENSRSAKRAPVKPSASEIAAELRKRLKAAKASIGSPVCDLARFRPVESSDDRERAGNLVDGSGSEWFPTGTHEQWIEIDLQRACLVEEVRVQWWGDYGKKTALALLSSGDDKCFQFRGAREDDVEPNGWTILSGWDAPARFMRLELSNPAPDCFGLGKQYGLRQICVFGRCWEVNDDKLTSSELILCWAELVFSSTQLADVQSLKFVRGISETAAMTTSLLQPLRPSRWPSGPAGDTWVTAGAPSLLKGAGKYYYELELGDGLGDPQIGWVTNNFTSSDNCCGEGVGDDEHGWAADGLRHRRWHCDEMEATWPTTWAPGDVVGCAVDVDVGEMSFSHNGAWVAAASFRFDPSGKLFYPAASMRGHFIFIFAEAAFRHSPPLHNGPYLPLLDLEAIAECQAKGLLNSTSPPGTFARP